MGLLSFFKRQDESTGDTAAPDAVAQARIRARRRLIGATVLLGIGIVGFPLLFETQPRPIPVDIPIEIPRREAAPQLVLPPAQPASAARVPPPPVADAAPAPVAPPPVITEREADQGREVPPANSTAAATGPNAGKPAAPSSASRPAVAAASAARSAAATPAPTAAVAPTPRPADDGQRARALLEGKSAAKASDSAAGRVVVQVGAYTDADKLREARQKVEKLGLKTYTQVVEADGARRTRVRVGPFATRDEADKAAARIKAAGLPVAVLSL